MKGHQGDGRSPKLGEDFLVGRNQPHSQILCQSDVFAVIRGAAGTRRKMEHTFGGDEILSARHHLFAFFGNQDRLLRGQGPSPQVEQ